MREGLEATYEKTLEEIAEENFKSWNEALQTKDAARVAELYTEGASFLPTFSDQLRQGNEEVKGYFEHFLEENPTCEILQQAIQPIYDDAYMQSGMYNFKIGPEDDRKTVEARFTFFWQKNSQGEWKIAHHHSSLKPNA